ncbi:MAG: hypothetical protein FWE74_02755 [Oscillospiraceae bacterium]|nr:hypothetical protein [Oscillospiraceae bacterium]
MNNDILKNLFECSTEYLKINDPKYDEFSNSLEEVKENFLYSLSENDRATFWITLLK